MLNEIIKLKLDQLSLKNGSFIDKIKYYYSIYFNKIKYREPLIKFRKDITKEKDMYLILSEFINICENLKQFYPESYKILLDSKIFENIVFGNKIELGKTDIDLKNDIAVLYINNSIFNIMVSFNRDPNITDTVFLIGSESSKIVNYDICYKSTKFKFYNLNSFNNNKPNTESKYSINYSYKNIYNIYEGIHDDTSKDPMLKLSAESEIKLAVCKFLSLILKDRRIYNDTK